MARMRLSRVIRTNLSAESSRSGCRLHNVGRLCSPIRDVVASRSVFTGFTRCTG